MTSTTRKKVPVTRHRLFPAIVALWCAALLGLGSFAVPLAVLSGAVEATGIAALVPAAAPPLGFTARALIALALTGIGGIAGLIIGRRIGRAPAAENRRRAARNAAHGEAAIRIRPRDSHPDAAPRRPFLASQDLFEAEPDSGPLSSSPASDPPAQPLPAQSLPAQPLPGRRRALAVTDESLPAELRDFAPVPGAESVAPLDLAELMSVMEPEPAAPRMPAQPSEEFANETPEALLTLSQVYEEPDPEFAGFEPDPVTLGSADDAALTTGAGIAPDFADADLADSPAENPARSPFDPPASRTARPGPDARPRRSPVEAVPLESLGTVQLVERLACALADYRERNPQGALPAILAAALRQDTRAAQAPAAHTAGTPLANPAPLFDPSAPRPVVALRHAFTELPPAFAEDGDFEADLSLPSQTARFLSLDPAQTWVEVENEQPLRADEEDEILVSEEAQSEAGDGYSSLIDMTLPRPPAPFAAPDPSRLGHAPEPVAVPQQVFIRVEDPETASPAGVEPVVLFPGQVARPVPRDPETAPAGTESPRQSLLNAKPLIDSDEAERALRTALATLQRMGASR